VHEVSGARALPSALPSHLCLSQLPGASRKQSWATSSTRPPPVHSPPSPVLPKHCHPGPGQTRRSSLTDDAPSTGGVAIGVQPVRDTTHLIAPCLPACLPCLDLPCPPVPKPPKTPQSSTTLNRSPHVGTDTSILLYHLLPARLVALPFLTPPIPHNH
jgi:hypothetical protein